MKMTEYYKKPLSVEYVFGLFDKLAITIEKYQSVISGLDELEEEIVALKMDDEDGFTVVLGVLGAVHKRKDSSPFMGEVWKNLHCDVFHGFNDDYPKHQGKYYVDSVMD